MHTEIQDIPIEVLRIDRKESEADMSVCELGLLLGMEDDGVMPLGVRASMNKEIITKIDAEIQRREDEHQTDE